MNVELFAVGGIAIVVGLFLVIIGAHERVSAVTDFGRYSGSVGGVVIVLGIILMAIACL